MEHDIELPSIVKGKRPIRVEDDIAFITLTKGYEAIIDAADVPLVEGVSWYAHGSGGGQVYAANRGLGRMTYLHRVIMAAPGGLTVDHRSTDTLDCRRGNLRIATRGENNTNVRKRKHNTTGFKGVFRYGKRGRFMARISAGGKAIHLGCFDTPEQAHEAYVTASAVHHGEFARHE